MGTTQAAGQRVNSFVLEESGNLDIAIVVRHDRSPETKHGVMAGGAMGFYGLN